jgi:hypothetical protein
MEPGFSVPLRRQQRSGIKLDSDHARHAPDVQIVTEQRRLSAP